MITIGLTGRARVGKDVAAQYLAERFGMVPVALAMPLKLAAQAVYNLDKETVNGPAKDEVMDRYGYSLRAFYQETGDTLRRLNPDSFLLLAEDHMAVVRREYTRMGAPLFGFTITDVRMENEAAWVRNRGGRILHIIRDAAPSVRDHHSESGIEFMPGDIRVTNNGTMDEFYKRLEGAVLDLEDLWTTTLKPLKSSNQIDTGLN